MAMVCFILFELRPKFQVYVNGVDSVDIFITQWKLYLWVSNDKSGEARCGLLVNAYVVAKTTVEIHRYVFTYLYIHIRIQLPLKTIQFINLSSWNMQMEVIRPMADSTHGLTQTWLLDSTGLFAAQVCTGYSQFCCGVLSHISVTSTCCCFWSLVICNPLALQKVRKFDIVETGMVTCWSHLRWQISSPLQGLLLIFLCGASLVAWNLRSIDSVGLQAWELRGWTANGKNACLAKDEGASCICSLIYIYMVCSMFVFIYLYTNLILYIC